ncbi:MAG: hypothetical protein CMP30_06965 [Roseibacillus sp.]|nr:hypothetical protein [Roseibacillus sp.]
MNIILTNPAGFFALLGIPAVILIHFLQRQAKVLPVSTLFLLAHTQRESVSGRRFDRLTNSVPLWLQILMVLLLTWLLVLPRYIKPNSTQQVALVLDSSASMSVFKEGLPNRLREELPGLQGNASRLQLYIFESAEEKPVIYAGEDIEEALKSLENWSPTSGLTEPENSLRLARSRVNREGVLIYVTDSDPGDLPFDAGSLSIGNPRENIGFTGLAFEAAENSIRWKALLRNYSKSRQSRTWHVVFPDGSTSQPQEITLKENSITTISSMFPADATRLQVKISPDDFHLDDQLHIVKPRAKTLKCFQELTGDYNSIREKFSRLRNIEAIGDLSQADLSLVTYDPLQPSLPSGNSVIMLTEATRSGKYLRGRIVTEKHPLMEGVNWQTLQARDSTQIQLNANDEILLWQGDRPMIALRTSVVPQNLESKGPRRVQQLIFNFDLTLSNAEQLECTALLLHRFTENLRKLKIASESLNTEVGQPIQIAFRNDRGSPPLVLTRFDSEDQATQEDSVITPVAQARFLKAPGTPGFFRISQGDEVLLESGSHFADTREADLQNCNSEDRISTLGGEAVDRTTREDHLWRLWTVLVIVTLLVSWHFIKDRPKDAEEYNASVSTPY